jgi:hypothetical protein
VNNNFYKPLRKINAMRKLENWDEVMNKDWPEMKVTERTRATMERLASCGRYLVDNVRLAFGRIYSSKKYESYRQRVLSTPLP